MPSVIPSSLSEAASAIHSRNCTAQELVQHCLQRIEAHNPVLNAFACLAPDALAQALRLDKLAESGAFVGPLHGIPVCIKDNIDMQHLPSRVGSAVFAKHPPAAADAVVTARLKAAGAIILGKNTMDEFAAHVSGITSFNGPCINPWQHDQRLSPGGSSSGTAVSVAAGFCYGGIGTDTGGSVRLPAGWCGLYGMRPSYGEICMQGVYPRSVCMDTVGVLTRSLQDMTVLLQAIADPPLHERLRGVKSLEPQKLAALRMGLPWQFIQQESSPEVLNIFEKCHALWQSLGVQSITLDMPLLDTAELVTTINTLRSYEFARDVRADIESSPHKKHIHPIPMADYQQGARITESAYHHALEKKAAFTHTVHKLFEKHQIDFFLLPTAATTAPSIKADPACYAVGRKFNNLFSITEVPTLAIPAGFTSQGLPIGAQVVGHPQHEHLLLAAGMAYETAFGPIPLPQFVE